MKFRKLLDIRLNLFEGGAAAAGGDGAGAAAPAQAGGTGTQGETQASSAPTRRGKSGEFDNVIFGKQAQPAAASDTSAAEPSSDAGSDTQKQGVSATPTTLEDRRRAYMDLVNSDEYKEIHTQETQRIINRRFKDVKTMEQQVQASQPFIDMMMQRYNITDGDIGKLTAAVEADNAYWATAAEEAGMSVEQYKQFQQLQRENKAFKEAQLRRQRSDAVQQQLQAWNTQAQQLKAEYPDFDLDTEMENPQFKAMLRSHVPMKHAYEVIHMEDIKAGIARSTAKATEKQVVDGIRAKGARPQENGTAPQSAFTVKDDVSKLTKKERAEIARRVARGEIITF